MVLSRLTCSKFLFAALWHSRVLHLFTTRTMTGVWLYDVDMRLRPSRSRAGFVSRGGRVRCASIWLTDAWTWELQALVRGTNGFVWYPPPSWDPPPPPLCMNSFSAIRKNTLCRAREP